MNIIGKCVEHGHFDLRIYNQCPCCCGKLGRKRKGEYDD